MYRLIFDRLKEWKSKKNRKPLIIQGARQVGKTWVMKAFGSSYFKKHVYINFESNINLQHVFKSDLDIARIITVFEIETGISIDNETLIILDEIQEAKGGLTALKYFYENAPQYYLMAAGSYLGVSLQKGHTFPVGKVDFLRLYPMNFEEFLLNIKEELLLKNLKEQNWEVLFAFHEKLISLLRIYYFVGGMPEAVNEYIDSNNLKQVRAIQSNILHGYENDFSKHAPIESVPKIRLVWQSIIGQLAKENKKFVYGQLRTGARAKEFESAINWLVNSGLVHKSNRITKPGIPLLAYADMDAFKLYLLDIGLLNAMAGLGEKILLHKNQILVEHKGAMTEQFVSQELKIKYGLFYWSAANGTSELDFIIQQENSIIPVEVKAEENLKAKSLRVFVDKYKSTRAIRTSMSFYRDDDWLENIPLYAVFTI
ncbi:MAG: ATP-binding protein [Bacteroidales bacterium]